MLGLGRQGEGEVADPGARQGLRWVPSWLLSLIPYFPGVLDDNLGIFPARAGWCGSTAKGSFGTGSNGANLMVIIVSALGKGKPTGHTVRLHKTETDRR